MRFLTVSQFSVKHTLNSFRSSSKYLFTITAAMTSSQPRVLLTIFQPGFLYAAPKPLNLIKCQFQKPGGKVTPHCKLEEVSPLPLAGSDLQVELPASNVCRMNSGGCVCGSACKHKTGVLGILNAFMPDVQGALPAPLCYSQMNRWMDRQIHGIYVYIIIHIYKCI